MLLEVWDFNSTWGFKNYYDKNKNNSNYMLLHCILREEWIDIIIFLFVSLYILYKLSELKKLHEEITETFSEQRFSINRLHFLL